MQTLADTASKFGLAAILDLPRALPPVVGMGGHLKASICVISGSRAMVSEPAGDLSDRAAVDRYRALQDWAAAELRGPKAVAHDLHPDFHSTRAARGMRARTIGVQHHHAHILATAWEHGETGPVLGLALDGFGLGSDGGSWGGELLRVEGAEFARLGHLRPLPQPGADTAARAPWRMGAAALHLLGRDDEIAERFGGQPHAAMLAELLARGVNCPSTSSAGRLFDAASGLLGLCPMVEHEAQAAQALQAMADAPAVAKDGWRIGPGGQLDLLPLLNILTGQSPRDGANLFHGTLAAALADWVLEAHKTTGIGTLALGGGCFANAVLTDLLCDMLTESRLAILRPTRLPPGDAGLSFGQAIAAALTLERPASCA